MKKHTFLFIIALLPALFSTGQENALSLTKDSVVKVNIDIPISETKPGRSQAITYTPAIINGSDTLSLPPVVVYGSTRYIQQQRNFKGWIGGPEAISIKAKDAPATYSYQASAPYRKWMRNSSLEIIKDTYCCNRNTPSESQLLMANFNPAPPAFMVEYLFLEPVAEQKIGTKEGQAFVDFPVNKTDIRPTYRRNERELAKITHSIDQVKEDSLLTITGMTFKGYASPEGPWDNNTRLARERTIATRNYVEKIYKGLLGNVTNESEPEDWEGFKTMVATSSLPNKEGILALIDTQMEPDAKEKKIKASFPKDYQTIKEEIYPALRHCDYAITYQIKQFSTIPEIEAMYKADPSKLSVSEFFRLAKLYPAGSPQYDEIINKAIEVHPDKGEPYIQAANVAMQKGDLDKAANLLSHAGNSVEALYARANLMAMKGDREGARAIFESLSIPQARRALERL